MHPVAGRNTPRRTLHRQPIDSDSAIGDKLLNSRARKLPLAQMPLKHTIDPNAFIPAIDRNLNSLHSCTFGTALLASLARLAPLAPLVYSARAMRDSTVPSAE